MPTVIVKAASTGNISPLSGLQTIDGVALVEGDFLLVKDQAAATENGVYIVSSGGWVHYLPSCITSATCSTEKVDAYVLAGTTNGNTIWTGTSTVGKPMIFTKQPPTYLLSMDNCFCAQQVALSDAFFGIFFMIFLITIILLTVKLNTLRNGHTTRFHVRL